MKSVLKFAIFTTAFMIAMYYLSLYFVTRGFFRDDLYCQMESDDDARRIAMSLLEDLPSFIEKGLNIREFEAEKVDLGREDSSGETYAWVDITGKADKRILARMLIRESGCYQYIEYSQ